MTIIKNSGGDEKTKAITKFFKDLNAGAYGEQDVSFNLFVLQLRRKHLLDAIKEKEDAERRVKGRRIMENLKNQLELEKLEALRVEPEKQ